MVDGTGRWAGFGPHYSRRTPGSRSFTGCGEEVVLVSDCGRAVWAVVRQRTPSPRGSGESRGRGALRAETPFVWRNMLFRNEGAGLSSEVIVSATAATYRFWLEKYGCLPTERLRTEVDVRRVRSRNPGFCYVKAGWERGPVKRGKRHLYAPLPASCRGVIPLPNASPGREPPIS